ncbi:phosphate system positive regulatory protein pho81 [Phlyctochytrium bullatum]|nr:phosphate system positive regulatory protein pho81 [Phlyctochytrium bullatum]
MVRSIINLVPNELLRAILILVEPNDIIALSTVNRHLRRAIPVCIDQDLARRHVKQLKRPASNSRILQQDKRAILFDHPVLFEHALAAFARFGLKARSADLIWGRNWRPVETDSENKEATWIRLHRVRQLRTAVQRSLWPCALDYVADMPFDPVWNEDAIGTLMEAIEMAGIMRSFELLDDLRHAFREVFYGNNNNDVDCFLFQQFLFGSAQSGFCESLSLIPQEHPILLEIDYDGATLLGLASASRHLRAVELLLAKGAPINPASASRWTTPPLFNALEAGNCNLKILRLLLEHGAGMTRHNGCSAVHLAVKLGDIEALKLLLEFGADVEDCSNADLMTPLALAVMEEKSECIRVLLDAGANVDTLNDHEDSALLWACKKGCLDTARILIDRGANVNPRTRHCCSPLHEAADRENFNLMKMLLDAGADVDWVDKNGETALHYSVKFQRAVTATLLLDAGANPNIKCNHRGCTPMHMFPADCTFSREWEVLLDRLIEKGADFQVKDESGRTAWHILAMAGLNNPALMRWVSQRRGYNQTECDSFARI